MQPALNATAATTQKRYPIMNNKVEGNAKVLKGSVEETAGKITKDRELEAKGKIKKVEGKIQKTLPEAKQAKPR